jgi:hypothetical protein
MPTVFLGTWRDRRRSLTRFSVQSGARAKVEGRAINAALYCAGLSETASVAMEWFLP